MSFSGTYNVAIEAPIGRQEGTLVLEEADGALSGTMSAGGESGPISNAQIEGDTASWDMDITTPMPMTLSFSAKMSGENIAGRCKLGMFGEVDFEGIRA